MSKTPSSPHKRRVVMASPTPLGLPDGDLRANRSTPTTNTVNASFTERRAHTPRDKALSNLVEGDSTIMRDITWAPPGDVVLKPRKSQPAGMVRKRSSFFEDAFSVKDSSAAKERIQSEAIVMAEVRTNVIINDEFTFITELSYHLSARYQRPVSSIVVTVQHGTTMLFGGTFEPAYVMTVFALPSQVLPVTNKRNAALIQKHMGEALGVSPERGFLRFAPMMEEHVACNGKTMAGEIDDLEKSFANQSVDESGSAGPRKSKSRTGPNAKSPGNSKLASSTPGMSVPLTKPMSAGAEVPLPPIPPLPPLPPIPPAPAANSTTRAPGATLREEKGAKRRKSFVSTLFGRPAKIETSPAVAEFAP